MVSYLAWCGSGSDCDNRVQRACADPHTQKNHSIVVPTIVTIAKEMHPTYKTFFLLLVTSADIIITTHSQDTFLL